MVSCTLQNLLNVDSSNVMAVLTISKLGEELPVYHGSTESVLQSGIGHLEYTSLPVGGTSTHAALSGHRGFPSKQFFTDLDQMEVGDIFYIDLLGNAWHIKSFRSRRSCRIRSMNSGSLMGKTTSRS